MSFKMPALVVQTVTARSMAELRAARDAASGDMVELRVDGVADLDVAGALAGRTKPVIFTCRAAWEGGRFDGDEATRLSILARAIELGAEYVDVEWRADRRHLPVNPDTIIVLSHHDFSCTPGDLEDRIAAMASEQPDVLKIAVTAHRLSDAVRLRDATRLDLPHIAIAMGPSGFLSRACPRLFGSLWTYGGTAAPGQLAVADLIDVYRVGQQTDSTALYVVAGTPLAHSASPVMHNAAFAALGMDAVYALLETDDAGELLRACEAFGVAGASVTAPLKTATCALVTDRDDLAARTGSVNTVRRDGDLWAGRNFDVAGFLSPLDRREEDLAGKRCVVLGAGGAARTAMWALQSKGALVEVAARRQERARDLAGEFGATLAAWPPAPGWDLLVNTTPVGTWPDVDAVPLDADAVRGHVVYDLIYNPEETALLRLAHQAGAETIGGLEMLVGQACLQFEWWTGRTAPRDVMVDAARQFLRHKQVFA
jgi:3-dehydroquinate dehydratase/shikimate dehydrogenase